MAIEVVIEFIAKTTVRIIAYVTDDAGDLADATTSMKVIIKDPDGTTVIPSEGNGDDVMTHASTGVYEYDYQTTTSSTKGWWPVEVVCTDTGDIVSIGTGSFRVK